MTIREHRVSVEEGELPLAVAEGGGSGAAVVIVPSVFGVKEDLQVQMEALAQDASMVVALDPFFREDPGPAKYGDMERMKSRLEGTDLKRTYRDFRAAIEWTRKEADNEGIVALGICFGGPYALRAAADGLVQGVVTWHGSRMEKSLRRAAEMRCPMRFHFGSDDPIVPMEAVDAIRKAFEGRSDVKIQVHEGASHGFSHPESPAYDAEAERAGMASVRELVGVQSSRDG